VNAASCRHHPEQAARGVCVHCGTPLCLACITKIDGINHCQDCLAGLAQREVEQASRAPGPQAPALRWLSVGVGVGLLSALGWLLLDLLLPPQGVP
jgi:hypothetical protein